MAFKLQDEEAIGRIISFSQMQQRKKLDDEAFNDEKASFYKDMGKLFEGSSDSKLAFEVNSDENSQFESWTEPGKFSVTQVKKRTVQFDAQKLSKRLSKKVAKKVLKKRHDVFDFEGLAKYVKSLGGDPEVFKGFFITIVSVDEEELNKLSELGEVKPEDVDGCYHVSESKPYYRVSFKADDEDAD